MPRVGSTTWSAKPIRGSSGIDVVGDLFNEPDDATPLTAEERHGLIPAHIAYRHELNEAEQENIARGQDWALGRRRDLLTEKFVKNLHARMFGDVWRWAGDFRTSASCSMTPGPGPTINHFRRMRWSCGFIIASFTSTHFPTATGDMRD
jgi:hypothetical protein